MSDSSIEKEIQEKGLTAPRITPERIQEIIKSEAYHVFTESQLTVCCLTLENGFTVTGESACASPENFDAEIGQKIAKANAANKIWALEGYLLKQRLHDAAYEQVNIARVCHEVNRAYCESLGDTSQPAWEYAPEWQRQSAILGVSFHLSNPDAGPDNSHNEWMKEKASNGWTYGPVKNETKKEHPCFVPYDDLPQEQKAKDFLFRGTVHAMAA